jgi:alkanesulfonate monooxygenase SsuD/methylene tetrahydromethanopterin reductase-like flavin-dependent oxidoreductase (luciferase family)
MGVRVGIGLFTAQLPASSKRSFEQEYRETLELVRLAERVGFDSAWVSEHHGSSDGYLPSLLTMLAAFAAVTERIELGTGVILTPLHDPLRLAEDAAVVDQLSGGRLLLGIGAGGSQRTPYAAEQRAIGQAVERDAVRAQKVVEAIELMRRLWSGHAGFLRPDPPPPIIVGGFGPRMAGIAGRYGDGFNTQAMHPRLADLARVARDEYQKSGRDPSTFMLTVFAGLDERWLQPDSRARQVLGRLDVARLILLTEPPYDPDQIRQAGRRLTPR